MSLSHFLRGCVLFFFIPVGVYSQVSVSADSLFKTLSRHHSRDSIRADMLNKLAYEFYLGSPEKSLAYAYEAISISREINYPKAEAQGLRQVGLVAWSQSNYASALRNFVNGLEIAEKINDQQIIADITGNMGLVYTGLGDYNEALSYHQKSLILQRKLKNQIREAVALNNLGDVERFLGNYDKAIQLYTRAIELRQKEGNLNGIATNLRNIGNVKEAQGELQAALKYYEKALSISDSLPDKRGMSQCRQSIASVYFKMKKYSQARAIAAEGLRISREAKYRAFVRDAYLLLARITEAQNELGTSYDYFKQYAVYKDSVVNLEVGSEIASYRLDYETQKKQAEIDLLRKDAQLQESRLAEKNATISMIVITLILVTILSVVLFRSNGRQRKVNEILAQKNKAISDQHKAIEQQRDELIALNEEIRAQREDIIASRDALAEKNISIAEMNEKILSINENLERIIKERTAALEKQNHQLIEYAFINAHKLRAPLARVMGLTALIKLTDRIEERDKLLELLDQAAQDLDAVIKSIANVVQEGIEVYEQRPQERS